MKRNHFDYILFIIFLVLLNLVCVNAFFRVDLTKDDSFSLSPVSKQTLATLEKPLSIKVFFTQNLPAPYNSVDRYLHDLLSEYKNAGKRSFSYEFIDMDKEENKAIAQSYGILASQIQEMRNDEVQVKKAYMGMAIQYGDSINKLNDLTDTGGLEYRITTNIQKMISLSRNLSDLSEPVTAHLYVTDKLGDFNISGFPELKQKVTEAVATINIANPGTLELEITSPETLEEIDELKSRYGVQDLRWEDERGNPGSGVLDLVLTMGDSFETVDIPLVRSLFGMGINGLDTLVDRINDSVEALVTESLDIGYVTGHGEKDLNNVQTGAAIFNQLISDMYTFRPVDTVNDDIPEEIKTLVINGPTHNFTDAELYKIDQFVMTGGRLLVFLDPYQEITPQQMQQMGVQQQQPVYLPIKTGLEKLLTKWGITPEAHYVLDSNCYEAQQQGREAVPLYYIPFVERDSIGKSNGITDSLERLIFLKTGYFDVNDEDERITVLVSSSAKSWITEDPVNLMPYSMFPPAADEMKSFPLAVMAEGKLTSYFDESPAEIPLSDDGLSTDSTAEVHSGLSVDRHKNTSVKDSRVAVFASSEITGPQLLSNDSENPNSLFVRNVVDYLNDNEDMNAMRGKGRFVSSLSVVDEAIRTAVKTINMAGLPILVILGGLIVWRVRKRRRNSIKELYSDRGGEA